ncbi:hypothetical protein V5O48_009786 [Marasmius crinis-equi]|uniref:Uncharacterized protein n=1 Tax=Marasmius crinis-equi TaxID=585013 RepID=A0ABR3FAQ0_9AGAR
MIRTKNLPALKKRLKGSRIKSASCMSHTSKANSALQGRLAYDQSPLKRTAEMENLKQRHFLEVTSQQHAHELRLKSDLQMEEEDHGLRASLLEQEIKGHKLDTRQAQIQLQNAVENHVTYAYVDDAIRKVEALLISQQLIILEWIDTKFNGPDP